MIQSSEPTRSSSAEVIGAAADCLDGLMSLDRGAQQQESKPSATPIKHGGDGPPPTGAPEWGHVHPSYAHATSHVQGRASPQAYPHTFKPF